MSATYKRTEDETFLSADRNDPPHLGSTATPSEWPHLGDAHVHEYGISPCADLQQFSNDEPPFGRATLRFIRGAGTFARYDDRWL